MSDEALIEGQQKKSVLSAIFSKKMGICVVTGFVSGLPLYVLVTLLTGFLRDQQVDLTVIGLFSLISFPYTWKFLWAPLIDRYTVFGIGRRRGWMLLTQLILIPAIGCLGLFDTQNSIGFILAVSFMVAFASATQDIAIDAYRRELLSDLELGLGNSLFVNAYRVAGIVPGGLSFILADFLPWSWVFPITAAFMLPGLILTIFLHEYNAPKAPRNLKSAVVEPWREFITRRGLRSALLVILFVFLYKLGDSMCTALATPFYIDMGYSKTVIGIVAKNVGLWSTVIGGLCGGVLMLKIGINKALWLFGFGQMITVVGFALLASRGTAADLVAAGQDAVVPSVWALALVIGAEALGAGLGTAAFVSFIAKETNPAFTATQFALLTSLSAVPRTFCNATTGVLVKYMGWENFFWLCVLLALPGMLLLFKVAPWNAKTPD